MSKHLIQLSYFIICHNICGILQVYNMSSVMDPKKSLLLYDMDSYELFFTKYSCEKKILLFIPCFIFYFLHRLTLIQSDAHQDFIFQNISPARVHLQPRLFLSNCSLQTANM